MHEDSADALAGYPRSHLDSVSNFLAGQYRRDAVGPLLMCDDHPGNDSRGRSMDDAGEAALPGSSGGGGGNNASSDSGGSGGDDFMQDVHEVLSRQCRRPMERDEAGESPAASADQRADAPDGSSPPDLVLLLRKLQAACAAALGRVCEAISPTLQLAGDTFSLGPAPALALGHLPPQLGGGSITAVAWQQQQQEAGDHEGRRRVQCVVVLRRQMLDEGGGGGGGSSGRAAEAAVLQLPLDVAAVVDLAFYKNGQLALLLLSQSREGSEGENEGGGTCRLVLVPLGALKFVALLLQPLPPGVLAAPSSSSSWDNVLQQLVAGGQGGAGGSGVEAQQLPEGCRQRALPYPRAQGPLAVSASRGVGCVLAGTQASIRWYLCERGFGEHKAGCGLAACIRLLPCPTLHLSLLVLKLLQRVLLYDLEEDAEEEEEEEEPEQGGMAGNMDDGNSDSGYATPSRS